MGALAAARWAPALAASLADDAAWLLSRSTGLVSFVLLWLSMLAGLSISTREARGWPGARLAYDLHRTSALLGLGVALLHAWVLVFDRQLGASLTAILVPSWFPGSAAVTLGQLALPVFGLTVLSSSLRRRLGHRWWRAIHFASFGVFALALVHGVMAGSDAGAFVVRVLYWVALGSVCFGTTYRILLSLERRRSAHARHAN